MLPEESLGRVVTLGHSAGGHLATWAAGRDEPRRCRSPTSSPSQECSTSSPVRGDGLGGGAVDAFLGHAPGPDDAAVDPAQQIPLAVPVWCVHAPDDDIVPISQSRDYVDRATAAGATAELVEVPGGHFGVIDVEQPRLGTDPGDHRRVTVTRWRSRRDTGRSSPACAPTSREKLDYAGYLHLDTLLSAQHPLSDPRAPRRAALRHPAPDHRAVAVKLDKKVLV